MLGRAKLYTFEQYYLKHSTQPARLHDWLRSAWLPAFRRLAPNNTAFAMDAVIAEQMPQVAVLAEWDSFDHWQGARGAMRSAADMRDALARWESPAETPYEHFSQALLEPASYSPALTAVPAGKIVELRIYHAPTYRQLRAMHERFEGPEIPIFHRCGIHPVLYTSALAGPWMPNLIYFTPFDSFDAREKAWATFAADPEWIRVRSESIEQHGQVNAFMKLALYRVNP